MSHTPPDLNTPPAAIPLKSFINNYLVIGKLGTGSFGTVILAKCKHLREAFLVPSDTKRGTLLYPLPQAPQNANNLVAVKTMNNRLATLNDYMHVKEIKFILTMPSHPNLVQVYELFVDTVNYQLHIVMELLSQNLYQLIKARKRLQFLPVTLKSILSQILAGIRHIHTHDYFHRDVKPENILVIPSSVYYGSKEAVPPANRLDNYIIKLADYGLARHVNNTKPYTAYVSTRWYRSPEILLRKNWYSRPADMWAFGCVAVEVANFYPLFPGTNEIDQTWRILKVLGSPSSEENSQPQNIRKGPPLGGYWDEAQNLSSRLGFTLPYVPGAGVDEIFPEYKLAELAEVVVACLTWDPNLRADVDRVCSMEYFAGSEVNREVTKHPMTTALPRKVSENVIDSIVEALSEGLENRDKLAASSQMGKQMPASMFLSTPRDYSIYDNFDDGYENDFMDRESYGIGHCGGESGDTTKDEIDASGRQIPEEEEDFCDEYDHEEEIDAFADFNGVHVNVHVNEYGEFGALSHTDFNDGSTEYDSEGAQNVGSLRNVYNWDTNTSHYNDTPRDMKPEVCDAGGSSPLVPRGSAIVSHGT